MTTPPPTTEEKFTQLLRVLEAIPGDDVHMECHTHMCLGGYVASDPWFNQHGLTLAPLYRCCSGYLALERFFGDDRVCGIFDAPPSNMPQRVSKERLRERIHNVMERIGVPPSD